MPGTKITLNSGEPDPDPAPFLFVSAEVKQRIQNKFYDPKRSCYVPHPEEKFAEGMIQETNGNKVKVKVTKGVSENEEKEYKQELVTQVFCIRCLILRWRISIHPSGESSEV